MDDSKIEMYLEFLYKLVKSNQIVEEKKIFNLYNDKIITDKELTTKLILVKKIIVKIKLSNSKYLLISDIPLNFLLTYSIIIFESDYFLEFELKEDLEVKKYICSEKVFEKIKEKFEVKNVKKIKAQELKNLSFKFEFNNLNIITEIRNYIFEKKKINLNKIRFSKNLKSGLFLPTVKYKHFNFAKDMNMPIISLIKENYIKDSNINVIDLKSQIEYIKPFVEYEEEVLWKHFEDKKTIRAVRDEIFFSVDKKFVERKLDRIENMNLDKEEILTEIDSLKKYIISSEEKKIILPLWKSHEAQKFIKIKSCSDFLEKSGVKFKLDYNYLSNIYIQTLEGEEALFSKKYLDPKILKIIENNSNLKNVKFSNIYDLVFSLVLNDDVDSVERLEENTKYKVLELVKFIKKICEVTIKKSIEFNKIPNLEESKDNIFDKYYISVFNHLKSLFEDFKKKNNRNEFLKEVLKISNNLSLSLKFKDIEFSSLFYLARIALILIEILNKFNRDMSFKINELFEMYFKKEKFVFDCGSNIDLDLEEMINSIIFLKNVSKKQRVYVILKKEIEHNLIPNNVKIMKNPTIVKTVIKPNIFVLKKQFPYSYKQVSEKIKNMKNLNKVIENKIEVKGRKIEIKNEYYSIYSEYKTYKQIFENDFFKILVVRKSN